MPSMMEGMAEAYLSPDEGLADRMGVER
jgi:hypothetical protein